MVVDVHERPAAVRRRRRRQDDVRLRALRVLGSGREQPGLHILQQYAAARKHGHRIRDMYARASAMTWGGEKYKLPLLRDTGPYVCDAGGMQVGAARAVLRTYSIENCRKAHTSYSTVVGAGGEHV